MGFLFAYDLHSETSKHPPPNKSKYNSACDLFVICLFVCLPETDAAADDEQDEDDEEHETTHCTTDDVGRHGWGL